MTAEQLAKGKELGEGINHYVSKLADLNQYGRSFLTSVIFSDNFEEKNSSKLKIDEPDIELNLIVFDAMSKYYTDKLRKLEKEFAEL